MESWRLRYENRWQRYPASGTGPYALQTTSGWSQIDIKRRCEASWSVLWVFAHQSRVAPFCVLAQFFCTGGLSGYSYSKLYCYKRKEALSNFSAHVVHFLSLLSVHHRQAKIYFRLGENNSNGLCKAPLKTYFSFHNLLRFLSGACQGTPKRLLGHLYQQKSEYSGNLSSWRGQGRFRAWLLLRKFCNQKGIHCGHSGRILAFPS